MNIKKIYGVLFLAFILWGIVFAIKPFNFWVSMSLAVLILIFIVLLFDKTVFFKIKISYKNILYSSLSSLFLYFIFFIGNKVLILINSKFEILNNRLMFLNNIYANKTGLSPFVISVLIVFPIAFGEEIFWRGFIQNNLEDHMNKVFAFLFTALLYTAVHIISFNPILIIAALTCGLFWGFIYMKTKNLTLVLFSHIFWDIMIFILFPVK